MTAPYMTLRVASGGGMPWSIVRVTKQRKNEWWWEVQKGLCADERVATQEAKESRKGIKITWLQRGGKNSGSGGRREGTGQRSRRRPKGSAAGSSSGSPTLAKSIATRQGRFRASPDPEEGSSRGRGRGRAKKLGMGCER